LSARPLTSYSPRQSTGLSSASPQRASARPQPGVTSHRRRRSPSAPSSPRSQPHQAVASTRPSALSISLLGTSPRAESAAAGVGSAVGGGSPVVGGSPRADVRVGRIHTTGLGGIHVQGDRPEPVPGSGAIAAVCANRLELFGFTPDDKRRMRQWVHFAVTKILDPDEVSLQAGPCGATRSR